MAADKIRYTRAMQQHQRTLSAFDTCCVVVGAIVGIGIFFNPSKVAQLVPTPNLALAAWAIAGVLALAGALAFAELGRRTTGEGAQYQILRDAFGPCPAFLFVFCNATAVQAGAIGIIAFLCARNAAVAVGNDHLSPRAEMGLSLALVAAVTAANLAGVRWGSRLQNLTVVAKIAALLAIVGIAALAKPSTPPASDEVASALSPVKGVMASLIPAFFAYGGWQHALWISGEVKDPRRNLPLGILAGTIIVVAVYLSANWAYLTLMGHSGVATSTSLAADAVAAVFPEWGRRAVAGAVAISAFGVLNAQLLSGPRLIAGMAADGRFFRVFKRSESGSTTAAILLLSLSAVILMFAAGFNGIDKLTSGVVIVDGVFFGLTALALLTPSYLRSSAAAGPSLPFAKIAAAIFVLGELTLLTGSYFDAAARSTLPIAAGWIAVATILYFDVFRKPQKAAG